MRLVKKVKCKTIFIHSVDDELIPALHSKLLYERANRHVEKELLMIKGPHDGPVFAPSQFKQILKFMGLQRRPRLVGEDLGGHPLDRARPERIDYVVTNREIR